MSKYTKGPLQYMKSRKPDNTGGYDYCVLDAEGQIIAETYEHVGRVMNACQTRPAADNARLFACAPDMAEMLLSMHVHISHGGPTRGEAEALLRKAGVL